MNSLIYSSCILPADSRQCRVLNLLPGPFDAHVRVEMRVMNLDDWEFEQYQCLSYVWGDPSITTPILVNNRQVQVTTNLRDALFAKAQRVSKDLGGCHLYQPSGCY
jgi:hypothetical protein